MKYLQKFEGFAHRTVLLESDLINIEQLLFDKMKENGLEPIPDNLISELDLIKNSASNSFLYYIIKDYFNLESKTEIIRTAVKFFERKYKDVIMKYKQERKKEFQIDNEKNGPDFLLPFNDELIKVPRRIGHDYKPIKILPLEELETKYSRHKRLKVFHHKGLKCVSCPKEGKYLIAGRDKGGAIHIDVYTKDFELMTVDHIKPKSIGGTYDIENLDPMCQTCNSKKADKYEELEG